MKIKPGSMGKPFPGITATVIDAEKYEPFTETGKIGLIAIKPRWPSMMRMYWNNEETYKKKFQNGWYLPGDRSSIDNEGYFWFVGRDDDVINTGGHLVSPFEVESALLEHPAVAESAVVAKPDFVNMEVVKAFVKLSPLAMPQEIEFIDLLPKTRSGKIMRRILHAKEWGEEIGDTSTLEND
jgi:acetyl-CoA synthetase